MERRSDTYTCHVYTLRGHRKEFQTESESARRGRGSEGGGGRGSCSGKMTSKPVVSSVSRCQPVTRQRQGRGQTEKAEGCEVASPAVMSALELGSGNRRFNRREGPRRGARGAEDGSKSSLITAFSVVTGRPRTEEVDVKRSLAKQVPGLNDTRIQMVAKQQAAGCFHES